MNKSKQFSIVIKSACFMTSFFLINFSSFAQFSLGIETGLNISIAPGVNPDIEYSSIYHPYLGISPQYKINEKFIITSNLEYSRKGNKWSSTQNGTDVKNRFSYLTITPSIGYKLASFLQVELGPYMGLLIGEDFNSGSGWIDVKEFDGTKSTDFGASLGIKGLFNNFYAVIAYEYGLSDISNFQIVDVTGAPLFPEDVKNRNFQFGVGYLIRL